MYKAFAAILILFGFNNSVNAEILSVDLRYRERSDNGFNLRVKHETWDSHHTAVIVCDMWDSHHCYNAVKRVEQLAPKIDMFVSNMRNRGSIISGNDHSFLICFSWRGGTKLNQRTSRKLRVRKMPS